MAATAEPLSRVPRETRGPAYWSLIGFSRGLSCLLSGLLSHTHTAECQPMPRRTRQAPVFAEARGCHVQGTLLRSGLGFPEGPVVMPDGSIVFCDGNTGELLRYAGGEFSTFAETGGSPWGAILGTDGAIYVTQGGNVPGSGDFSAVPSIQRVNADGSVEQLASTHRRPSAGRPERPRLRARRPALVHRLRHRGRRPLSRAPARPPVRHGLLGRRRAGARAAERLPERHRLRRPGPAVLDGVDGAIASAASRTARRRRSRS